MILSFLTMYISAKKSTFVTFVVSRFPTPPLLFAVGFVRDECADSVPTHHVHLTPPATPPQSDQVCSLFSNMAQFPGRVKILKQYLLFEMDTVENNIFTLNI